MGILKRFADIMSANFNGIIDKFEDPEKMIDQYLRNLEKDLGKVKSETAQVMVIQKKAEARIKTLAAQQERWLELAKKAIAEGNERDATKFTEELIKAEDNILIQADAAKAAKENTDKMLAMHDKLMSDMEVLKRQRDDLIARNTVAKAAATVESLTGNFSHSIDSNIAGYNRMREKIEDSIVRADALHELNTRAANEAEELSKKYDIKDAFSKRVADRLSEIKSA